MMPRCSDIHFMINLFVYNVILGGKWQYQC